jgi:hypothetical protein
MATLSIIMHAHIRGMLARQMIAKGRARAAIDNAASRDIVCVQTNGRMGPFIPDRRLGETDICLIVT